MLWAPAAWHARMGILCIARDWRRLDVHLFEPAVLQSCAEESYCKQSSTMFGGAEAEAAHMFFKHASPVSFYQSDRYISQLHRSVNFFRQGQKHLLARSGMSEVS
jgi:hypothetical protein